MASFVYLNFAIMTSFLAINKISIYIAKVTTLGDFHNVTTSLSVLRQQEGQNELATETQIEKVPSEFLVSMMRLATKNIAVSLCMENMPCHTDP